MVKDNGETQENETFDECILTGEPGENPDDCTTHDHRNYDK